MAASGHFGMSENNFRSQFLPFQIDTQLFFFEIFFTLVDVVPRRLKSNNGRSRVGWFSVGMPTCLYTSGGGGGTSARFLVPINRSTDQGPWTFYFLLGDIIRYKEKFSITARNTTIKLNKHQQNV